MDDFVSRTSDEYADIIAQCVELIINGESVERVLTDPFGQCSRAIGRYDLETVADCTLLLLKARRYSNHAFSRVLVS